MKSVFLTGIAVMTAAAMLGGCGGDNETTTTTTPTTTISGSAVKGLVANATITIKNAATNAVLATTTTNSAGVYSVNVQFTGDVIVEVSGGTYTDEATNVSTTLSSPMKVVVTANGSAVTGIVSPLTTIAYTNAFGAGTTPVTATAFNTSATNLATQFNLNGVNLATTVPDVSATANSYGQVLRGISKYLQTQNVSLESVINTPFTAQQLATFSAGFTSAYSAINPGTAVTFSFDGAAFNIAGTNAGGGTGTCGVNLKGTVSSQGVTVPLDLNYCISGIAAGSCTAGNSTLSQALAGQSAVGGAVNLNYTYASTCAAGAIAIKLQ